jgi:DNA repair exonuclease SbcCD ATPase subunit
MRISRIGIWGFFKVKELEISIPKSGRILVLGQNHDTGLSNETGKSTIWEALTWCLFGRYSSGSARPGDSMMIPKSNGTCVEVHVIIGKEIYQITRRVKWGEDKDTGVYLHRVFDGTEFSLKGQVAANEQIEQLIGIDYNTWIKCHYFSQLGMVPFGSLTDKDLKRFFLDDLLSIEWIAQAHENAKQIFSEYNSIKEDTRRDIEEGETRVQLLETHTLELAELQKEWKENRTQRIKDLHKEYLVLCEKYETRKTELALEIGKYDVKSKVKEGLIGVQFRDASAKLENVKKMFDRNEFTQSELLKDFNLLKSQREDLVTQIGNICPYCGVKITEKNLPFMEQEFKEKIETLDSRLFQEVELGKKLFEQVAKFQREYDEISVQHEDYKRQIAEFEIQRGQLEKIKAAYDIPGWEKQVSEASSKWEEEKANCENRFSVLIETNESDIKKLKNKLSYLVQSTVQLEQDIERAFFWVEAFGASGIQSFLLESITPALNNRVSHYLSYLADGRISATFSTIKRLKSGEYREKFGLDVVNRDGGAAYNTLSGGAKRRIDLACAFAISDLRVAMRGHNSLDILILDEVFEYLDDHWLQKLFDLLDAEYQNRVVYVVSHREVPSSQFTDTITVHKKNGVTELGE